MQKIKLLSIAVLMLVSACGNKNYTTYVDQIEIQLTNDSPFKFKEIDGQDFMEVKANCYKDELPIDSLQNITVYIAKDNLLIGTQGAAALFNAMSDIHKGISDRKHARNKIIWHKGYRQIIFQN
jgi:hypothetical protein